MRISSVDRRSHLDITRNPGDGSPSFAMSCVVDTGHARFCASNVDVHLPDLGAFADHLDRFISDRSLAPTLEGTYGSFIKVHAPAHRSTVVLLRFAVGDASCEAAVTLEHRLDAAFPIDQEALNSLVADLRELACRKRRLAASTVRRSRVRPALRRELR